MKEFKCKDRLLPGPQCEHLKDAVYFVSIVLIYSGIIQTALSYDV